MRIQVFTISLLLHGVGLGTLRAQEPSLPERVRLLEEQVAAMKTPTALENALTATWKNGPRLRSTGGDFEIRFRARLQADAAFFSGEDDVNQAFREAAEEDEVPDKIENGAEVRRVRLGMQGLLYDTVEYKVVYDFADGESTPKDVYMGVSGVPGFGTLRLGHQREPFSRLQGSSAYYVFLEKGLQNALTESRDLGVRMIDATANKRVRWSAGAFRATDNGGSTVDEDAYSLTARLSGVPWQTDDGQMAHLGAAYSYRRPPDEEVRFNTRPNAHFAPSLIGLGKIPADTFSLVGAEGAVVLGPFSVLGEYIMADVDALEASNPTLDGYYVFAGYFLTGETRRYSKNTGAFSRLVPNRNFDGRGGWGAWEVAVRYSALDVSDGDFDEGEIDDVSLALNGYLNPVVRVLFNYTYADAEEAGDLHIVQTRFQVDF